MDNHMRVLVMRKRDTHPGTLEGIPRGSPKTGHRGSLQNRPTITITRDIDFALRAATLGRCEQCLERGKETASYRIRAAGMVAAKDPKGHWRPARDGR